MSVSRLLPTGGANDFNVAIGGTYTSVTFDKEYSPGAYTMTSSVGDTSFDIYAYNANGTLVGYTNTPSLSVSGGFSKLVILGGTGSDLLSFTYKTTYTSVNDDNEVTAGPFITSLSTTVVPANTSTITVTGGNYATNITGTFTSASTATVYTATITRNSVTSLTVGFPTPIPANFNTYVLNLTNPGVTNPSGSNVNKSSALTLGVVPTWTTGSTVNITLNASNTITLAATAVAGNTISSYTIVSGTLPTGLSLNTSSGVITGTPTVGNTTVVFRATDNAGSFTNRTILFNANPVWTTAAGALTGGAVNIAYSNQLAATDDITAAGSLTYAVTAGTLPAGISLSSGGLLSGTPTTGGTSSFTVTVSDTNGGSTARAFTVYMASEIIQTFATVGSFSWTYPANAAQALNVQYLAAGGGASGGDGNAPGGGGGAGGLCIGTLTLTPGTTYSYTVGGGGLAKSSWSDVGGNNGGSTWFVNTGTVFANGGGAGAGSPAGPAAQSGGSGGGGAGPSAFNGGAGASGNIATGGTAYGNAGAGQGGSSSQGGGGGGAGGAGQVTNGGAAFTSSFTNSSYAYCRGGDGAFSGGSRNATNYGDGGRGGFDNQPGSGFQGVLILKYFA